LFAHPKEKVVKARQPRIVGLDVARRIKSYMQ